MDISKVLLSKEFFLLVVATLLIGWVCFDGLALMVSWWEREEYSHGYLIPLVAIYLLWQKREILPQYIERGSYFGVFVVFLALLAWLLGELSAIYTIIQYAFLIGVFGLAISWIGIRGTLFIWAPIFYLVFMVPLPNFLYFNLSQELQLISSSLGVAVIRFFDISVFLEGNVIDLGVYQLQVVEACSGLRYLFPLMSFGFLIAYIYRGPVWQRALIFLSTVPITVLMNSFRIGVIGVTVEHFGIAAAEGFLHDFEGWIVFMACLAVLLFEIWIFYQFSSKSSSFGELFDLDFGGGVVPDESVVSRSVKLGPPAWISLALLVLAIPATFYFTERSHEPLERETFASFPLGKNTWVGREASIEADVLETLKLSDYIIADYKQAGSPLTVNFYSAWYEEQTKGASIHSPKSCLPGGGWLIQSHTIENIKLESLSADMAVNRVLMQMGEHQQLVYYWFQGRNRNITNEYLAKWHIFTDALLRNRTDGALVRLVTYIPEGSEVSLAESRLNDFMETFQPLLPNYVPN